MSVLYSDQILDSILNDEAEFEIIDGYYFEQSDYIFRDYIEFLYGRRLEFKNSGDFGMEKVTKLLMNGLYGRLGINCRTSNITIRPISELDKLILKDDFNVSLVEDLGDKMYLVRENIVNINKEAELMSLKGRVD
jgi:hypothetical protein